MEESNLTVDNRKLREQLKTITQMLGRQEGKNIVLTAEVEQLRRENKELTATLVERNQEIDDLKNRLDEMMDKLVQVEADDA
jgi:uncharacterized coiled-coil protein SlyX